jgi:predicted O-methyltransferase YrrM
LTQGQARVRWTRACLRSGAPGNAGGIWGRLWRACHRSGVFDAIAARVKVSLQVPQEPPQSSTGSPAPGPPPLLTDFDDRFVRILGDRFMHDRGSLGPLIERVAHRGTMVEVGSLCGFSTAFFAARFERVISIDPYAPGYDPEDRNSEASRLRLAQEVFKLRFFDDPRVTQHNETSEAGAKRFGDRSLDFVYLDAGHSYDAVRKDISLWLPKVREDSWIAGDDYDWEGARPAIEEAFSRHDVIENRWIARVADAR